MEQQELHLTVNGEDHNLACDPDLPLLDVLQEGATDIIGDRENEEEA